MSESYEDFKKYCTDLVNKESPNQPFKVGEIVVFTKDFEERFPCRVKDYSHNKMEKRYRIIGLSSNIVSSIEGWWISTKGVEFETVNGWFACFFTKECRCNGSGWITNFTSREACPCGKGNKQVWM